MGQLVSMEMDRVMSVHHGYLRDLDRRSRETAKMLKRFMKDFKADKKRNKKAKKSKSVAGRKENHDNAGEDGDFDDDNHDDDDDNNNNSSSSSSSSDEE